LRIYKYLFSPKASLFPLYRLGYCIRCKGSASRIASYSEGYAAFRFRRVAAAYREWRQSQWVRLESMRMAPWPGKWLLLPALAVGLEQPSRGSYRALGAVAVLCGRTRAALESFG